MSDKVVHEWEIGNGDIWRLRKTGLQYVVEYCWQNQWKEPRQYMAKPLLIIELARLAKRVKELDAVADAAFNVWSVNREPDDLAKKVRMNVLFNALKKAGYLKEASNDT